MTPEEKQSLHSLLCNRVVTMAIREVCAEMWGERKITNSLESKAMAFEYMDGAVSAFDRLLALAEMKQSTVINPKRLKQIQ